MRRRPRNLLFPIDEIDAFVLSHANIGQACRLPRLINKRYAQTIWRTSATRHLCAVMLADSVRIQAVGAGKLNGYARRAGEVISASADRRRWRTMQIRR
jgi:metallo-beta-lactamase family protein